MDEKTMEFLIELRGHLQQDGYDAPKGDLNATIDNSIDMINKFIRKSGSVPTRFVVRKGIVVGIDGKHRILNYYNDGGIDYKSYNGEPYGPIRFIGDKKPSWMQQLTWETIKGDGMK